MTAECNMKYRSRTDISKEILEAANGGGATKTKIMYKAYLSYQQLKDYLSMLIDNGLIAQNSPEMTFSTTVKGLQYLKVYDQMSEISNQFREQPIPAK
jgi:predicted transcriptional regulator